MGWGAGCYDSGEIIDKNVQTPALLVAICAVSKNEFYGRLINQRLKTDWVIQVNKMVG